MVLIDLIFAPATNVVPNFRSNFFFAIRLRHE
jgi:hypothetical protein